MNWLRKFMMGRYGGDQFGIFLIILSIVLSIALMFVPIAFIGWLSSVSYTHLDVYKRQFLGRQGIQLNRHFI